MVVIEAIAVWLFIDAITWISGQTRYTIFFERLFDTPTSVASLMRWVQGAAACIFSAVGIAGLISLERRVHGGEG